MFVLKGILGGSLKITSETKKFKANKNSLKRFLGLRGLRSLMTFVSSCFVTFS